MAPHRNVKGVHTLEEIASITGLTAKTVEVFLWRAKKKMRKEAERLGISAIDTIDKTFKENEYVSFEGNDRIRQV